MYRRYRDYRQRRRRRSNTDRRPRSPLKRPIVQIAILIAVGLIIYLLLQNSAGGGNSLPSGSLEWQLVTNWYTFFAKPPTMYII